MNDDKLRLTTRFVREGRALVLRYAVENRDSRDVYLLNRIPGIPPKRDLSPHHVYIGLDRSASTVRLYKKVADIPDYGGSGPTAPVAPYVTPVRAGTTFREEVRMPLPLRPWEEYGRGAYGPGGAIVGKERSYSHVDFVLGYYWRAPDTKETRSVVQGQSVILPSSRTYPELGELRSETVTLELPVIQPPEK